MALQGTADNVGSVIRRGGNTSAPDVTLVGLGDNAKAPGDTSFDNDDVKSRDSDAKLGNRIQQRSIDSILTFAHERVQPASGYDMHGRPIEAVISTDTTFANDEAADDGYGADNGQYYWNRSKTITSTGYPPLT